MATDQRGECQQVVGALLAQVDAEEVAAPVRAPTTTLPPLRMSSLKSQLLAAMAKANVVTASIRPRTRRAPAPMTTATRAATTAPTTSDSTNGMPYSSK